MNVSTTTLACLAMTAAATAQPWTMTVFPDTQVATRDSRGWFILADDPEGLSHFGVPTTLNDPDTGTPVRIFDAMAKWIVEAQFGGIFGAAGDQRQVAPVLFSAHVGDIVNNADNPAQWDIAEQAYSFLQSAGIEFGLAMGNHDDDKNPDADPPLGGYFRERLGNPDVLDDNASFIGVSGDNGLPGVGNSNANVFLAPNGDKFCVIHVAMSFPPDEIAWASHIIEENRDAAVIVVSHSYLFSGWLFSGLTDSDAQRGWDDFLSQHPQICMILSGHTDGDNHRTSSIGAGGEVVYEILQDYQTMSKFRSNGLVRVYNFDPDAENFTVSTYSSLERRFRTADDQAEDLLRLLYHWLPDRDEFQQVVPIFEQINALGADLPQEDIDDTLALLSPTPLRSSIEVLQSFDPDAPDAIGNLIVDLLAAATIFPAEQVDLLLAGFGITVAELEALLPPEATELLTDIVEGNGLISLDSINMAAIDSFDANLAGVINLAFDQTIDADADGSISPEEFRATLLNNRVFLEQLFLGFFDDGSGFEPTFTLPFRHSDYALGLDDLDRNADFVVDGLDIADLRSDLQANDPSADYRAPFIGGDFFDAAAFTDDVHWFLNR